MFVAPILFLIVAGSRCEEALRPIAAALQQKDMATADALLEKVRPECSSLSAFHEMLGIASELDGNFTVAAKELQEALVLNPQLSKDPAVLLWLVQSLLESKQERHLDLVLSARKHALSPPMLFSLGMLFARSRDYERAIEYLQLIPRESADDAVYFNLGLAYSHLTHFADARRCYFQAIDEHPDHVEAYFSVGLDFAASGDLGKALPWLFRARDLAPARPDIAYALVEQLVFLKYLDTAAQVAAEALTANPQEVMLMVANGDIQLARTKTEEAVASYQKALLQQPKLPGALLGLARVAESQGDSDAARKALLEALSNDPENTAVNAELGAIDVKDGDWDEAYTHLARAWAADKSNPAVGLRLAQALEHTHRPAEALHLLQPLASALGDSSSFHFELVQIYAQLGRTSDAQAERVKVATLSAEVRGVHFEAPGTYVH